MECSTCLGDCRGIGFCIMQPSESFETSVMEFAVPENPQKSHLGLIQKLARKCKRTAAAGIRTLGLGVGRIPQVLFLSRNPIFFRKLLIQNIIRSKYEVGY